MKKTNFKPVDRKWFDKQHAPVFIKKKFDVDEYTVVQTTGANIDKYFLFEGSKPFELGKKRKLLAIMDDCGPNCAKYTQIGRNVIID